MKKDIQKSHEAVKNSSDIRVDKVDRIKAAITEGSFHAGSHGLAEKFLFVKNYISKFYLQNFYERPNKQIRTNLLKKWDELKSDQNFYNEMEHHAKHLCDQGYTLIPGYFNGSALANLKSDFERFASAKEWDEYKNIYLPRDALSNSAAFSQAVVDPFLTDLVEYYIGKKIFLAAWEGRRSERFMGIDENNEMWHHDAKRKQVKVFIYLTEVLANGQHTDILPKTHKVWHEFSQNGDNLYDQNRIKDYFAKYGKPINSVGPAGTVCIFDTNALHRGNRNGPKRDALIFYYTAGRHLNPLPEPHPNALKNYSPKQRDIARLKKYF